MSASVHLRPTRRPIRERLRRHAGSFASVMLHVGLIVLLLLGLQAPSPTHAPKATISVITLGAPSVEQRVASNAATNSPPTSPAISPAANATPRPRKPKPVKPRAVSPPAPSTAAALPPALASADTSPGPAPPAAPSVSPASAPTVAAAAPQAEPPKVPPPIEYLRRVSRIISLSQKYPWTARQYGHQGDVIVRMHLRRDGAVMAATLIRSSGHESLDAEARDVILRIRRFPPFPADYIPQQGEFDIDQPVSFRTYLN